MNLKKETSSWHMPETGSCTLHDSGNCCTIVDWKTTIRKNVCAPASTGAVLNGQLCMSGVGTVALILYKRVVCLRFRSSQSVRLYCFKTPVSVSCSSQLGTISR